MTLTKERCWRTGRRTFIGWIALGLLLTLGAWAQGVSTTTVQGTVYLANGQPGSGTLILKWPAFTSASGQAVAASSMTVPIPQDGFMSVNLAPNQGATPAGEYYTAVFYMSDGSTNTEYWVVPSTPQTTLAQVRAQVMPAAQAVQAVSKSYVDQSISALSQSLLTLSGGSVSGPLYLSGDPTQPLQAADKRYVDTQMAAAVPLAGGNMTGALSSPAVNGVQAPAAASAQTTLQGAINAAGANGAMQIPPGYAATDGFTNPNGVRVTDLRTGGAQQTARSVKEFGAVCDGVTDDTNALQAALNYANAHNVALTLPQGTCKTRALNWRGESIGGLGKQVSALMGFPGQDVLATAPDAVNLLSNTRLHDLTIYVDQSMDVSCSAAEGRAPAGSCQVSRLMEKNSIFSPGGNGLTGTQGTGAGWAVGNCAIAMPASTGLGGNGLKVAEIENVAIAATGTDPMAAQYPGAYSTHTCGMYLAQWPQWSEFRNIDIRGLNTGVAIPALPVATPAGLGADSNRWQNVSIRAAHGFTAGAGSNNVLDNVVAQVGNSAATGEAPTGLVFDLPGGQQGWTVRNAVVTPTWNAVQPALAVTAAGGAVTAVAVGAEHGLGWDPYGVTVPVVFSGSCTAQATAAVNSDGSIGAVTVTQAGVGCSTTTAASISAPGTWDTAAAVNLVGGQNMTFFAGNLLKGNGGYTVWNAASSRSYGTQLDGGGGVQPGGGTYAALVGNGPTGGSLAVDQFPGADFGAKLQACVNAVNANYGGTCDARNFTGNLSMGSNLTLSTGNTTVLLPCATIATANQIVVTAGTRNVALRGCALRGGSAASGSQGGTAFSYSGAGAMIQVGDPAYLADTPGFHLDNVVINTTASGSATAQGLIAYRTQELDLESLYLLGNANQTGMTLDGTGNYTGGTFLDDQLSGFQTAVNAVGHQVANPAPTDWLNASTFVRLHINCPTSGGSPIAGTYGINLQQGDGNTFTGGDVEGCATALHLGANAQNNTIVGLRNENSTKQVVADAGSSYNNWITGGTMYTGQLTDNGTRNSFLDTFHRSFNGLTGDWYGSQQDATVTNHFRLGTGTGNERGLLNRYQTDYGYRWTTGLSDAVGGEQYYQILDELNSVYRLSIGQYNNGQASTNDQTVMNSAGTGAVVLNGSNNAGTGGVVFGSGGPSETTVATISNAGNAQFNGALQVGGTTQSTGTMTVRNNADAEVDYYLWPGLSSSQKGAFTYKDWNGASQWYLLKDANNNWALNSAVGGLDSFKAYQSTNSGDTYVNASNASGVVRVNYETGAGTAFKVYGGNSGTLYASFTGSASIAFPGLAAASGHNCLQIDSSGYITNTGSACGTGTGGSGGSVSSATPGFIAYYTGNGTSIGGISSVPLTAGGTGAITAAGANLSITGVTQTGTLGASSQVSTFPGTVGASAVTSSVNNVINVMAAPYNAKGDCATDDHAAIYAALEAAYNATYPTAVYFPTPPGGCYLTSTLPWLGVSMYGPPRGLSLATVHSGPSSIQGQPGEDIFNVSDPSLSTPQVPNRTFTVENLEFVVDDSTDVSASHPNRKPGRTAIDGAITSSSAVLTSTNIEFSAGDAGQAITVAGAGAGGANLTTTIASLVPGSATQVNLAAAASTTVTGAQIYVSLAGISATATVGNCAIAVDNYDGNPANWGGIGLNYIASYPIFRNISFLTTSGNPHNSSCGMFMQGQWGIMYGGSFENVNFNREIYGYVQAAFAINPYTAGTGIGSDYMTWKKGDWNTTYPFISYDGGYSKIEDVQIAGPVGPQILQVQSRVEVLASAWSISIPEFEQGTDYGMRLEGANHLVTNTELVAGPTTLNAYWDASDSTCIDCGVYGALLVGGNRNHIQITQSVNFNTFGGVTDLGIGNIITGQREANPSSGNQPTRPVVLSPERAGPPVQSINSDFVQQGLTSTPFYNSQDLLLFPQDLGVNPASTLVMDSNSLSGRYRDLVAGGYTNCIALYNATANPCNMTIGGSPTARVPASKVLITVSEKCPSIASLSFTVYATATAVVTQSLACAATYTTQSVLVDLSTYSGSNLNFGWSAGEVDVAWIGIAPFQNVYGNATTATALAATPAQCTGLQYATGITASGAANCSTPSGSGGSSIVASIPATSYSGTAGLPSTLLYTTNASTGAGLYRFCWYYTVTVAGTAGNSYGIMSYINNGHTYGPIRTTGNVSLATQWTDSIGASGNPYSCDTFQADAGTAIYYGLAMGGVTGTPTVVYSGTLERLK